MPTLPVGDVLRALVPTRWRWVRWVLDRVKGMKITRGDTTIVLSEDQGATPPRTGLDQPHQPGPPPLPGGRRR